VEPGIYLPLELGVRIENIVSATTEGHECLNAEPSPILITIS
jgi:Xaa-Pro aminopeptidase